MDKYDEKQETLIPLLADVREYCCGCGVCGFVCPQHAITMMQDTEGFFYPSINEDKCIGCGKCVAVCSFKKDLKYN